MTDDCFYSQILDFEIIASGETALDSFESVGGLALDFFKNYKEKNGEIYSQPKALSTGISLGSYIIKDCEALLKIHKELHSKFQKCETLSSDK